MKLLKIVLPLVVLSACAKIVPPESPLYPSERFTARKTAIYEFQPIGDLTRNLSQLEVTEPRPFSLFDVPVCTAANVVFADQLGVPVSCEGTGNISIASNHAHAADLVSLFSMAVRSLGGVVARRDNGFFVSGNIERGAALSGDTAPPDADTVLQNVGFTVSSPTSDEFNLLKKQVLAPAAKKSTFLGSSASVDDLRSVAETIGLSVDVVTYRNFVLVSGDQSDVDFLKAVSFHGVETVLSLYYPSMNEDGVAGFSTIWPDLRFSFSDTEKTLRVAGPAFLIHSFFKDYRGSAPVDRNVKLEASIYAVENQTYDKLSASFGFNAVGNSLVLRGGSSVAANQLLIELEHSAEKSDAVKIASPSIVVRSGTSGSFSSGKSVPVLNGVTEDGEQDVDYIQAGTSFSAFALVKDDQSISLDVVVKETGVQETSSQLLPEFSTSSVETSVSLRQGDTVYLGGLDVTSDVVASSRSFFSPSNLKSNRRFKYLVVLKVHSVF